MDTDEHDPHRPRAIGDLVGAGTVWERLAATVAADRPDPPHLILMGPAGVGKSCALRMALRGRITHWMRCSADPSLRDSRDRIKNVARQRTTGIGWIVLEHADALHADSQAFLRRVIETSVGSTRFVLEVRDAAAIAEPLLSRTVLFNVPAPLPYEIRAEIQRRAPATPLAVAERLATQSAGNVRWAVLQALAGGDGYIAPEVATLPAPTSWGEVLAQMELVQQTGTAARIWLGYSQALWERPGCICPWAATGHALSKRLSVSD
jgi:replication-associated recombination protein RarA